MNIIQLEQAIKTQNLPRCQRAIAENSGQFVTQLATYLRNTKPAVDLLRKDTPTKQFFYELAPKLVKHMAPIDLSVEVLEVFAASEQHTGLLDALLSAGYMPAKDAIDQALTHAFNTQNLDALSSFAKHEHMAIPSNYTVIEKLHNAVISNLHNSKLWYKLASKYSELCLNEPSCDENYYLKLVGYTVAAGFMAKADVLAIYDLVAQTNKLYGVSIEDERLDFIAFINSISHKLNPLSHIYAYLSKADFSPHSRREILDYHQSSLAPTSMKLFPLYLSAVAARAEHGIDPLVVFSKTVDDKIAGTHLPGSLEVVINYQHLQQKSTLSHELTHLLASKYFSRANDHPYKTSLQEYTYTVAIRSTLDKIAAHYHLPAKDASLWSYGKKLSTALAGNSDQLSSIINTNILTVFNDNSLYVEANLQAEFIAYWAGTVAICLLDKRVNCNPIKPLIQPMTDYCTTHMLPELYHSIETSSYCKLFAQTFPGQFADHELDCY